MADGRGLEHWRLYVRGRGRRLDTRVTSAIVVVVLAISVTWAASAAMLVHALPPAPGALPPVHAHTPTPTPLPPTGTATPAPAPPAPPAPPPGRGHGPGPRTGTPVDWPMYMSDASRDGASSETILSNTNGDQLDVRWFQKTGATIAAQPAIVNGVVYVGSWDGYEYALNESTGAVIWKSPFLGQTTACGTTQGITSSAEVTGGVVYVGGGDSYWYALDASTGAILWKVFVGDNSPSGGHYNWSSPLINNGYAYIGIASLGDCPLVQGQVLKVSLTTHTVVATANLVPNGQVGAGVWTSPSLDFTTNTIYVTTGTLNNWSQTYSQAIVALDATTLAIKDSWQVPASQSVVDSDWGTSPILFTDSSNRQLVAGINKNGIVYAFQRGNLAAGPVWERQIAVGGGTPTHGDGSVSNLTFANGVLYAAGGNTTIGGYGYQGSVRALNPATGAVIWEHGDLQAVLPGLSYDDGLILAGTGWSLEVLDASTGTRLYSYNTWGPLFGPAAVSNGIIVFGSFDSFVYALSVPTASSPPPDPNCPATWTCQDLRNPSPAGSETVSGGTWTISADGTGVAGTDDQVRYISQNTSGNMQLTADLTGLSGGASSAQVGLMARENMNPKSPAYAIVAQPDGTLAVMYRWAYTSAMQTLATVSGVSLPIYVEIQRIGDRFQAAVSPDGTTYTLVPGTTVQLTLPASIPVGVIAGSGANGTLASATVAAATISSTLTPPNPAPSAAACPIGWSCADVGNPITVGNQSLSGNSWTLSGSGAAFGVNNFDQFHYVWQPLPGDGMAAIHVLLQSNTNASAQAGVMMRQSADPSAPFYAVFVTPGDGIEVFYRDTPGAFVQTQTSATGKAPTYLEIVRSGTTFTAYTSNGAAWTPIAGSSVTLSNLSGTLLAGAAVTSAVAGTVSTVTADSLYAGGCAAGWGCADVGTVGLAGSEASAGANGFWAIQGSGGDISGTSDGFHFVSQALAADGTLSARVDRLGLTDPGAKAGLMFRLGSAANAPFYAVVFTPSGSLLVLYRASAGATVTTAAQINSSIGTYLRIARFGTTFTAYTSIDGATWTPIGPAASLSALSGTLQAGLAVTSRTSSSLALATFDTVTLTGASACPTGWICADVGSPTIAGSQSSADALWSVSGAGSDITGASDQFTYVYQPLGANDTLATGVIAQSNTSGWAKAGVMVRSDITTGAAFYGVFVTPGNGILVEYRATAGGTATQLVLVPGGAPTHLRVTSTGTSGSFTAYTSGDGSTWQPIAGSTITIAALSGPVLAGIAVTSANPAAASQVIVDATVFSVTSVGLPPPSVSRRPR